MSYSLSLIVPIYNAENYIEKCIISICEQTLEKFEIILIDDCSPDNSLNIAKKIIDNYPNRKSDTKIIKLNENKGVAFVRKYAFDIARGVYIASLDSDDFLELNALQDMLNLAEKESADIVMCDFFENYGKEQKIIRQLIKSDNICIIKQILMDELHGSLSNKLIRKKIIDKVLILDDVNMSEDLLISVQSIFLSKKIVYYPNALFHYVKHNNASISSSFNVDKINQMIIGVGFLEEFFLNNKVYDKLIDAINYRKFLIKYICMLGLRKKDRLNFLNIFENEIYQLKVSQNSKIEKKIMHFLFKNRLYFFIEFLFLLKSKYLELKKVIK